MNLMGMSRSMNRINQQLEKDEFAQTYGATAGNTFKNGSGVENNDECSHPRKLNAQLKALKLKQELQEAKKRAIEIDKKVQEK